MPNIARNVRVGVLWGLALASLYSLYVIALVMIGGPAPLERQQVTLPQILLVYWVGGIVGGLVTGLLLPLGRWLLGSMFVGFLAALPVFAGFQLIDVSASSWRVHDLVKVLVLSGALGSVCGAIVWKENHKA